MRVVVRASACSAVWNLRDTAATAGSGTRAARVRRGKRRRLVTGRAYPRSKLAVRRSSSPEARGMVGAHAHSQRLCRRRKLPHQPFLTETLCIERCVRSPAVPSLARPSRRSGQHLTCSAMVDAALCSFMRSSSAAFASAAFGSNSATPATARYTHASRVQRAVRRCCMQRLR